MVYHTVKNQKDGKRIQVQSIYQNLSQSLAKGSSTKDVICSNVSVTQQTEDLNK
jgi:hypothetical protein